MLHIPLFFFFFASLISIWVASNYFVYVMVTGLITVTVENIISFKSVRFG